MRTLYLLLLTLATPFVLLLLRRRGRDRAEAGRWRERLGWAMPVAGGLEVWVHAASFGEVQAATPLIEALLERHGDGRIGVTTMTATGSDLVRQRFGPRVVHAYLPIDLPACVRWRLARWRPRRVVVLESELWPTLYRELARRRIPLLLANARMSPRSQRRYRLLGALVRETVASASAIAAQSAHDAAAYRALGAGRVEITGNLKFDCVPPPAQLAAGRALRDALGAERPVWVAASTHEGEEQAALEAHRRLLEAHADAVLILVPRHPQRFDAVVRLIERSGCTYVRRSAEPMAHGSPPTPQVLLGDSMGEMFCYLAASDLAFVGGSLVPVGGHNVLEPAALGLPVLFGPHMHKQRPARALLLEAGAAREVADATELADAVASLLHDRERARQMGLQARAALQSHQGATMRVLAMLQTLPACP
ncbi:lipid IV(A) 3-deoxy-D-manno-octulosonic acid transferase [Sinimarinibacterium thermocellulolyticum]|uniref:3-deoxy-D-manno-octulosonic acid transferase n=1 Tax=Sinimarinibacterium thermocellulolyticum TaxID=3170016 RepID=A0ABV2A6K1_9GAMM